MCHKTIVNLFSFPIQKFDWLFTIVDSDTIDGIFGKYLENDIMQF